MQGEDSVETEEVEKARAAQYIKQIGGDVQTLSHVYTAVGILATIGMIGALYTRNFDFANALACLGPSFLGFGILQGILARGFLRLQPWAYPFVKVLFATAYGPGLMDGYPWKIRSPGVRRAFGLDPLPKYEGARDEKL